MSPRLESSARDYAIALLSPTNDLCALDALESVEQLAGLECWSAVNRALACVGDEHPDSSLRILRARVALYLRLLRRVEAWERAWRFSFTHWACFTRDHPTAGPVYSIEAVRIGASAKLLRRPLPAAPWRPLWTSAPPHAPGVTARMLREVKR